MKTKYAVYWLKSGVIWSTFSTKKQALRYATALNGKENIFGVMTVSELKKALGC